MKKTKPPHYWHEAKKFLSKKDKKLAKIINQYDGYLVSRDDPFYSLCRSIIGQQISVKAADSMLDIKNLQKMSDDEAIKSLVRVKGIGVWTAQMFLIFNLKRSNIFPFSDIGLIKAISKNYKKEYPLKKEELDYFKNKWHPYSTVATWYMWRSIDPVPVEY